MSQSDWPHMRNPTPKQEQESQRIIYPSNTTRIWQKQTNPTHEDSLQNTVVTAVKLCLLGIESNWSTSPIHSAGKYGLSMEIAVTTVKLST